MEEDGWDTFQSPPSTSPFGSAGEEEERATSYYQTASVLWDGRQSIDDTLETPLWR